MVPARFIISQIVPLPEETKSEHHIIEIPTPLVIDGTEYRDNDLPFSTEKFSDMLLSEEHKIETAANPPSEYAEIFNSTPPEMPIFVFCLSTKISGFYKSVISAAHEAEERDVTVIDTLFCPPGPTLYAFSAAREAADSNDAAELKRRIRGIQSRIGAYWALFSLEYLQQTGRISAAKAFLGKLLKLVPVITVDREGLIIPAGKTRRIEKSLDRISRLIEKDLEQREAGTIDILVSYTGDEANGLRLKEKITEQFDVGNALFFKGGYCVHRYLGPNAAGLSYIANQ